MKDELNTSAGAGPVEQGVRPRAPHVDAVMKHVYRLIGAGKQWTHEHIAAIETELWRVLDDERNAERERCAKKPLTRQQIDDVMTQHYPLSSLLREEVDAFEACVRDLERRHGIGA